MTIHALAATPYVAASTANLLISYLDQQQLALPDLRERLAVIAQGPRMTITTWWALLADMAQAHPIAGIGLDIGRCARPHHIGVMGYLAMSCDTLGQAMWRFSRFQPLLHNLAPSLISQSGNSLVMGWGRTERLSTLISDDVVAAGLVTFARQLTGRQDISPSCVESPHPMPDDAAPYREFYGCDVNFGSDTSAIHWPLWALSLPINSQDPHLMGLLEQQAEALLQALPQQDPLLQALQQAIVAVLKDGPPELSVVAARMAMSERALYRALQERGLRYKEVLNALRYELAKDYLRDAQLTLPEISLLLGYAEQSVFSRAFKVWAGLAPLRWRKNVFIGVQHDASDH